MARGINDCLKRWENDVSAIYYPIKYNDNGKVRTGKVRTAVRPIQLYEIVFPEEYLNDVLETVPDTSGNYERINPWYKHLKKMLQKLMGVKQPEQRKHNGIIHAPWVAVSHIGIKKDERDKLGCELL